MHIKILRKLLVNEEETVLHKPSPTDLKLSHSTSIRILYDLKEPEPMGTILRYRPQIQSPLRRLQIALV